MKSSRTSLNKPFYDWIKEVREADKKIEELEDKLYYYNVKLIGYNSPNFEPRLSSTKPEYKDNRYIWIQKINIIEKKIKYFKKIQNEFKIFRSYLSQKEKVIINNYTYNIDIDVTKSRSYSYVILNNIIIKFMKLKKEVF